MIQAKYLKWAKSISIKILICVALVEITLWIGFRQGQYPEIELEMTQEIPGLAKKVHFSKNKLGLRTNSIHKKAKEADVFRIIIIGASTAEQATQSNEDTWGIRLEEELKQLLPNKKIELGIYAQGGLKTHQILNWCYQELVELEPDLVVTLFGINNLATDISYLKANGGKSALDAIETPPSVLTKIASFSQSARYLKNIAHNAKRFAYTKENKGANFDVAGLKYFRQQYHLKKITKQPLAFSTELIEKETKWLFKFLDQHDIMSLTLSQPSLYKAELDVEKIGDQYRFINPPQSAEESTQLSMEYSSLWFLVNDGKELHKLYPSEMRKQLDRLNDAQLSLAAEADRYAFPLHQKLAPNGSHFFDDCHFTDKGSHQIAKLIAPLVAEIITSSR